MDRATSTTSCLRRSGKNDKMPSTDCTYYPSRCVPPCVNVSRQRHVTDNLPYADTFCALHYQTTTSTPGKYGSTLRLRSWRLDTYCSNVTTSFITNQSKAPIHPKMLFRAIPPRCADTGQNCHGPTVQQHCAEFIVAFASIGSRVDGRTKSLRV